MEEHADNVSELSTAGNVDYRRFFDYIKYYHTAGSTRTSVKFFIDIAILNRRARIKRLQKLLDAKFR